MGARMETSASRPLSQERNLVMNIGINYYDDQDLSHRSGQAEHQKRRRPSAGPTFLAHRPKREESRSAEWHAPASSKANFLVVTSFPSLVFRAQPSEQRRRREETRRSWKPQTMARAIGEPTRYEAHTAQCGSAERPDMLVRTGDANFFWEVRRDDHVSEYASRGGHAFHLGPDGGPHHRCTTQRRTKLSAGRAQRWPFGRSGAAGWLECPD